MPTPTSATSAARTARLGAIAIIGFGTACSDPPAGPSTSPRAAKETVVPTQNVVRDYDDLLAEIADSLPGFGGVYYDNGTPTAYITDVANSSKSAAHLASLLEKRQLKAAGLKIKKGEYDFRDLKAWRAKIHTKALRGIVQSDVDESVNRVTIGVIDASAAADVAAAIRAMSIPELAVRAVVMSPTNIEVGLQNGISPALGGVQIESTGGLICTLGALVVENRNGSANQSGPHYLMTNSHCTGAFGSVGSVQVGQPTLSANVLGSEAYDPPLYSTSTDAACPVNRLCRRSDAALYLLNPGVDFSRFGYFAKSAAVTSGNPPYNGSDHYYGPDIVSLRSVGDPVLKVGRTTGTTSGTITNTCVHVAEYDNNYDTGRTMLCQMQASYKASGGDSGSPVMFGNGPTGPFTCPCVLTGMHWGSSSTTATFSSMDGIRLDYQPTTGFAPWPVP